MYLSRICAYVSVYVCTRAPAYKYIFTYIYIYTYLKRYLCMYVCIFKDVVQGFQAREISDVYILHSYTTTRTRTNTHTHTCSCCGS